MQLGLHYFREEDSPRLAGSWGHTWSLQLKKRWAHFATRIQSSEQPIELCSRNSNGVCIEYRERAEYCFESTVSEERTHWVLRQTRWVLRKTRWVRFGTQIIGWEELTEFAPRNSVSPEKLTEFGVWNRTLRNRIRAVSENNTC